MRPYLKADMVRIQRSAERCARLAAFMLSDPRVVGGEPDRFPTHYSVTDEYQDAFQALSRMPA